MVALQYIHVWYPRGISARLPVRPAVAVVDDGEHMWRGWPYTLTRLLSFLPPPSPVRLTTSQTAQDHPGRYSVEVLELYDTWNDLEAPTRHTHRLLHIRELTAPGHQDQSTHKLTQGTFGYASLRIRSLKRNGSEVEEKWNVRGLESIQEVVEKQPTDVSKSVEDLEDLASCNPPPPPSISPSTPSRRVNAPSRYTRRPFKTSRTSILADWRPEPELGVLTSGSDGLGSRFSGAQHRRRRRTNGEVKDGYSLGYGCTRCYIQGMSSYLTSSYHPPHPRHSWPLWPSWTTARGSMNSFHPERRFWASLDRSYLPVLLSVMNRFITCSRYIIDTFYTFYGVLLEDHSHVTTPSFDEDIPIQRIPRQFDIPSIRSKSPDEVASVRVQVIAVHVKQDPTTQVSTIQQKKTIWTRCARDQETWWMKERTTRSILVQYTFLPSRGEARFRVPSSLRTLADILDRSRRKEELGKEAAARLAQACRCYVILSAV
ncbi:hypothetical protein BD410DRAFT_807996 [Rickenella mellea]|uniref:Uncharacterized protein n=1 Tax=Rickenella mellea TaxID=50990 RepID=A0A4Y7PP51_9AGAM|nr:hypothetical protein BD410DRAFT_807996 [Rickenella mellea]